MQPLTNLTEAEDTPARRRPDGKCAVPDACTLRAEAIRALCLDAVPDVKVDPKGIWIVGATIVGPLDLEALELDFPFRFDTLPPRRATAFRRRQAEAARSPAVPCVKGIDAAYLEVATKLILGENFSSEGDVRLYGAKITATCMYRRSFRQPRRSDLERPVLDVEGAKIDGSAFLSHGFTAEGEVRLSRARSATPWTVQAAASPSAATTPLLAP